MNTKQVAHHLGLSEATIKRWRKENYGPKWYRIGKRFVRYKLSDVLEWEASQNG